jgi:hypothetical protein
MEDMNLVVECGCARMVPLDFIDMTSLTIDSLHLTHVIVPTVVQHRLKFDGLCLSVCLSVVKGHPVHMVSIFQLLALTRAI